MKKILLTWVALIAVYGVSAQPILTKPYQDGLSVHVGLDLGAAIPWPITELTNGSNKFHGTPRPHWTFGIRYTKPFNFKWSLGAEITHKRIELDAKTRVTNQKFRDINSGRIQYFTGTAHANMDFPMWELPVYARYTFRDLGNSVILGIYASWCRRPIFESVAKKGFLGEAPNEYGGAVNSDVTMSFTEALSNWDFGLLVGYERKITRRCDIGARLVLGLTDIFKADEKYLDYRMLPIRGSFLVSYLILRRN